MHVFSITSAAYSIFHYWIVVVAIISSVNYDVVIEFNFLEASRNQHYPPTWFFFVLYVKLKFKFKLYCDQLSVGLLVLVYGPHLGPMIRFLLLSDICGLHVEGCPPWRKDVSEIYSYNLLSLSGPSPSELMTTSYCLIWDHILLSHTRLPQPGGRSKTGTWSKTDLWEIFRRVSIDFSFWILCLKEDIEYMYSWVGECMFIFPSVVNTWSPWTC
jgi:hypothetical protein